MFSTLTFAHVATGKHIIKATLLAFALGLSGAAHAQLQPLKIRLASDLVGPRRSRWIEPRSNRRCEEYL